VLFLLATDALRVQPRLSRGVSGSCFVVYLAKQAFLMAEPNAFMAASATFTMEAFNVAVFLGSS
jgi:hypothetical protein